MLRRNLPKRLPLSLHGAIAGLLISSLIVIWPRTDALSRAELLIPAAFWTVAVFIMVSRRRQARSWMRQTMQGTSCHPSDD